MTNNDILFGKNWFTRNQKVLLWLLNKPGVKIIIRSLLGIYQESFPITEPIIRMTPNSFSYGLRNLGDKYQITTEFRTQPIFGKRVHTYLKPLWKLCHIFDQTIANPFRPAWNLGFDTLTAYPDYHAETATFDGCVQVTSDVSWVTARNQAAADLQQDSDAIAYLVANELDGTTYRIVRSIFLFDTSALTVDATISAATFSLYAYSVNDTEANYPANIALVSSSPSSNTAVTNTDYNISNWGTTRYASDIDLGSWTLAQYNDMALNADGRAYISKTSITKFGVRGANDIDNAGSPTARSYAGAYFAASARDATKDPKLVVTYTLPAATNLTINGAEAASVDGVASPASVDGVTP